MVWKTTGTLCLALATAACAKPDNNNTYSPPPPPYPPASIFCTGNNQIDNGTRFGRAELQRGLRGALTEALGGDRLAQAGADLLIGRGMNDGICPR